MATPEGRHLKMSGAQAFGHGPKDHAPISVLSGRQVDRRVLAPPIDLEIELELVALVQFTHARAFNRADVHEGIRLAIITRDEAKALHGVEELHGAGGLFASQLALRRSRLGSDSNHVTNDLQIGRRDLAAAINEVEFQLLAFRKPFKARTLNRADVDEHVLTTVFALDESETLLGIEELHDALAGADNLCRHAAACAAAGAAEATTTTAAAARTAAEATAVATAEAATITASETAAITAAETTATATATETTAIKTAAAETTAAAVRVEAALVTEPIALVASATPPPSVKTHKNQ